MRREFRDTSTMTHGELCDEYSALVAVPIHELSSRELARLRELNAAIGANNQRAGGLGIVAVVLLVPLVMWGVPLLMRAFGW